MGAVWAVLPVWRRVAAVDTAEEVVHLSADTRGLRDGSTACGRLVAMPLAGPLAAGPNERPANCGPCIRRALASVEHLLQALAGSR